MQPHVKTVLGTTIHYVSDSVFIAKAKAILLDSVPTMPWFEEPADGPVSIADLPFDVWSLFVEKLETRDAKNAILALSSQNPDLAGRLFADLVNRRHLFAEEFFNLPFASYVKPHVCYLEFKTLRLANFLIKNNNLIDEYPKLDTLILYQYFRGNVPARTINKLKVFHMNDYFNQVLTDFDLCNLKELKIGAGFNKLLYGLDLSRLKILRNRNYDMIGLDLSNLRELYLEGRFEHNLQYLDLRKLEILGFQLTSTTNKFLDGSKFSQLRVLKTNPLFCHLSFQDLGISKLEEIHTSTSMPMQYIIKDLNLSRIRILSMHNLTTDMLQGVNLSKLEKLSLWSSIILQGLDLSYLKVLEMDKKLEVSLENMNLSSLRVLKLGRKGKYHLKEPSFPV